MENHHSSLRVMAQDLDMFRVSVHNILVDVGHETCRHFVVVERVELSLKRTLETDY